ncbi:MAG: class I SAM-dependent methyltransferase [candidate division Zixibacteria bacterium]|nr:class I SAM-dependent methyltransferase [candidate division Zixibacteria bacterium]
MNTLEQKFSRISGGRILDVATGEGGFIQMLKESLRDFDEFIGVDIIDTKFNKAKETFEGDNISFAKMDGAKLAFDDNSFDTVSISNSLHHMGDINKTLKEMNRVLKPGGNFIIFEVFRDNQTGPQLNHVDLHHWWAKVNRLEGITHNPTLTRPEIEHFAKNLNLSSIETVEYFYAEEDQEDDETLTYIYKTIDEYIDKLNKRPDSDHLIEEGLAIKGRIQNSGFAWATELAIIGIK